MCWGFSENCRRRQWRANSRFESLSISSVSEAEARNPTPLERSGGGCGELRDVRLERAEVLHGLNAEIEAIGNEKEIPSGPLR